MASKTAEKMATMDCTKVLKEDATLFVIFVCGRFVIGKVEFKQHTTCSYKANFA